MIDFGESIDLYNENVFYIADEDYLNKINSVPGLAFQCRIAKIRPAAHGQLLTNWSDEAIMFKNVFPNKFRGIVSIINLKKST